MGIFGKDRGWDKARADKEVLEKRLKDATLSSLPPAARDAHWERTQASRLGMSVQAYRERCARRDGGKR